MTMDCQKVQSLISEYSVGLIGGRRKSEVEAHLAECPECAAELEKLNNVMLLVDGLDSREPPAGLWNGVYNRITQPSPRLRRASPESAWRHGIRRRVAGWSVGFAAAALALIMFFSRAHDTGNTYAANEYLQGHAAYASQELFADQAALNSVAAIAYREQVGGRQ